MARRPKMAATAVALATASQRPQQASVWSYGRPTGWPAGSQQIPQPSSLRDPAPRRAVCPPGERASRHSHRRERDKTSPLPRSSPLALSSPLLARHSPHAPSDPSADTCAALYMDG